MKKQPWNGWFRMEVTNMSKLTAAEIVKASRSESKITGVEIIKQ